MNIWNESLYAIYIVTESTIIYDQSVNFFLPMGDQGDRSMEMFSHTLGISSMQLSQIFRVHEQDWVVLVLVTLGFVLLVGLRSS